MSRLKEEFEAERTALDQERRASSSLRAHLATLTKERDRLLAQLGLIERFDGRERRAPHWLAPRRKKSDDHRGTLCIEICDTHFDEVVNPDEIDGLNCYNREIGELRLRRCVERGIMLAREYLGGVRYDGVVLFLGGDILSGDIHEELAQTNVDTVYSSLEHWVDPMVAAVGMFADEFRRVHVAAVAGNHGRKSRKPRAKRRAADNLDWLLYRLMARDFRKDDRVTWQIAQAADAHVTVHNTRYLLTHGDQFRGGSGIAAALSPLLLGTHRKTRRQAAAGRPYDVMVCGHFHQSIFLPSRGLLVGGTLKGYDEYAYCVTPETPVLRADLRWSPAGSLKVGDTLFAFSEHPVALRDQPKAFRVWQYGEVLSTRIEHRPIVAVHLASGRSLYSTPEHRWLARRRAYKPTVWIEARNLAGERGGSWELGRYLSPWEQESSWEAGWLAAFFEGEGSFGWRHGQSNLALSQKEGPTLERARNILRYFGASWSEGNNDHGVKSLSIRGQMRDKLRLLGRVGADRLIWKVSEGNRLQTSEWDRVVAVEPVGTKPVVVMATSTGTFIADGYGAHNCNNLDSEPPQQALWVTTPEHGVTFSAPIFVSDRRSEGW